MENEKDVREMTADTIGADLLQALLAELRPRQVTRDEACEMECA